MFSILDGLSNIFKGVLLGIKMAVIITVIITFSIFVAFLMINFDGFTLSDIPEMITDVKDFSITDVADGAVDVVVDGVADVTVGIYDFIMDSVHSSKANTGLSLMFKATSSLVNEIASTL